MERRQVNFTVNKSTDEGLDKLAQWTFRSKGQVIDWLVAEELAEQILQAVVDENPPFPVRPVSQAPQKGNE